MIEAGIESLLLTAPEITSIIGTALYAVLVPPDATYPCLSYSTITRPPQVNLDKSALESKRVQIDCWAKSYPEVKVLQVTLHAALDGYQGTLPDGTIVNTCDRDIEADYFESD